MEKVLITGGAGFIGRFVADELLKRGHQVRVLDALIPQVHGEGAGRPDALNAEAEFLHRHATFGLQTDVDDGEVLFDADHGALDDGAFHEVAVVEVLDGCVDSGEEILFSSDVVDGNLRNVVGGHR